MPDTAPCEKCRSEISTEADRCPECGYEPGDVSGISTGLLFWISLMVGGIAVTIGLASIAIALDGAALNVVLTGVGLSIVLGAPCAAYLYGLTQAVERKPAEADSVE